MVNGRFRWRGLCAVLLALMAHLGAGVIVPAVNPIANAAVLCLADKTGGSPAHAPDHMPPDCPMCPLCTAPHVSFATLMAIGPPLLPPAGGIVLNAALPPPSTGPPVLHWPPGQPRAPPIFS